MNWLGWIEAFPIAIKLPNLFSAMPRVPFVLLEGSRVFSSVPFCSFCGLIQNLSFCSFAFIIQMENVVIEVPHVFKKNPLKREPYCQYVLEEWWKTSLNGWCMLGIKVNFSIDTLRGNFSRYERNLKDAEDTTEDYRQELLENTTGQS